MKTAFEIFWKVSICAAALFFMTRAAVRSYPRTNYVAEPVMTTELFVEVRGEWRDKRPLPGVWVYGKRGNETIFGMETNSNGIAHTSLDVIGTVNLTISGVLDKWESLTPFPITDIRPGQVRHVVVQLDHVLIDDKTVLEPTPAKERSLLVRPASASPEDQKAAQLKNGVAPLWEGGR